MRVRLNVVVPVGLLAIALAGVAWFDLTTGGEATPAPPEGAIGTPVRNAYVEPPTAVPTPTVARPKAATPSAAPTGVQGSPADRDAQRRRDLLLVVGAASKWKEEHGSLPSTDNHVQTLCTYEELDKGCAFGPLLGGKVPKDPLGNAFNYWYSSDGATARFYTSLEQAVPEEQLCDTDDAELVKHPNVICVDVR